MRTIILTIFLLVCTANTYSNPFAEDAIISDYLPLAVGNVYRYHYAASSGYSYNYNVRVIKDTIINSKKYFILNQPFSGYIGKIIRVDSITGNIYKEVNFEYCPYSPFEELVDSLFSRIGDTALVCTSYLMHICTDTSSSIVFNIPAKKKSFRRFRNEMLTIITYGFNFGIISATYSFQGDLAGEWLTGCYINGVLYGDTLLTGVSSNSSVSAASFLLHQNYPNPFNPETVISYSIPSYARSEMQDVKLIVYDLIGKEVITLVSEKQSVGNYSVEFNGEDYPSGIYFYSLKAGNYMETKRMTLLK